MIDGNTPKQFHKCTDFETQKNRSLSIGQSNIYLFVRAKDMQYAFMLSTKQPCFSSNILVFINFPRIFYTGEIFFLQFTVYQHDFFSTYSLSLHTFLIVNISIRVPRFTHSTISTYIHVGISTYIHVGTTIQQITYTICVERELKQLLRNTIH